MHTLKIRHSFDASHQLPDDDLLITKACANPHGHTYHVEMEITANEVNRLGMVVDFKFVKNLINDWLDHKDINTVFRNYWDARPSTAENIARFIYHRLQADFDTQIIYKTQGIKVCYVAICEGYKGEELSSWCIYEED